MPATPSRSFLTAKWGPMPVWGWGAIGLGGAYLYSRYKSNQSGTSTSTAGTSTTNAAGEPVSGQPEYIIENTLPAVTTNSYSTYNASTPVNVTLPPPVVTPPGTSPTPPTNHHPPVGAPPPITRLPTTPPSRVGAPPAPSPAKPTTRAVYRVQHGDNLSTIAAKYGLSWQQLWTYNTTPGVRSAADIATLKQRGPNLIYAGEQIYIPS